jgi:hypothetical protein
VECCSDVTFKYRNGRNHSEGLGVDEKVALKYGFMGYLEHGNCLRDENEQVLYFNTQTNEHSLGTG